MESIKPDAIAIAVASLDNVIMRFKMQDRAHLRIRQLINRASELQRGGRYDASQRARVQLDKARQRFRDL